LLAFFKGLQKVSSVFRFRQSLQFSSESSGSSEDRSCDFEGDVGEVFRVFRGRDLDFGGDVGGVPFCVGAASFIVQIFAACNVIKSFLGNATLSW